MDTKDYETKAEAMDELRGFIQLLVGNDLKHVEVADIETATAILNLAFNRALRASVNVKRGARK
jgi:tRNA(Phe) wybutosine-synthesizing methylase Tyw3